MRGLVGFRAATPVAEPAEPAVALDADAAKKAAAVDPLLKQMPPYVPDFTKAFEFICVHTGGLTLT